MRLSQAEVYEVATFYHHFDVVKEGETPPPRAHGARLRLACPASWRAPTSLLEKLPGILGKDVRVLHAPCVGRCESAPVAVVGQNPILNASVASVEKRGRGEANALRRRPLTSISMPTASRAATS